MSMMSDQYCHKTRLRIIITVFDIFLGMILTTLNSSCVPKSSSSCWFETPSVYWFLGVLVSSKLCGIKFTKASIVGSDLVDIFYSEMRNMGKRDWQVGENVPRKPSFYGSRIWLEIGWHKKSRRRRQQVSDEQLDKDFVTHENVDVIKVILDEGPDTSNMPVAVHLQTLFKTASDSRTLSYAGHSWCQQHIYESDPREFCMAYLSITMTPD